MPRENRVGPASVPAQHNTNYKRCLPHWRDENATYFVTWRLAPQQPDLEPGERDIVVSAMSHFQSVRYDLSAFVVMNDHVHGIVQPYVNRRLQDILHSWKSFTAMKLQRSFGREGAVWQREYFDRIIRDEVEFKEKMNYVLANPAKRWPELEGYRWVSWAGTEAGPTR